MLTVGDVVDHVAHALVRSGRAADQTVIYLRVREIVIQHLKADPDKITRSSRFIEDLGMS